MLRPHLCCIAFGAALLVASCGGGDVAPGEGLAAQDSDATQGPEDAGPEQAVIVHVVAGDDTLFLDLIEGPLIEAIDAKREEASGALVCRARACSTPPILPFSAA